MIDKMITRMGREEKGFTLIELLIVVAIIAILAAVAIPNFLNARARATLSAVKSDMKNISTALETYQADKSQYPDTTAGLVSDYMTKVPSMPNGQGAYRYEVCALGGVANQTYALDTNDKAFGVGAGTEVYVTNGAGVTEGDSTIGTGDCTP